MEISTVTGNIVLIYSNGDQANTQSGREYQANLISDRQYQANTQSNRQQNGNSMQNQEKEIPGFYFVKNIDLG